MTKPFEIIYSQQKSDFITGRAYANPRFFTTPRQGVTKVYLVGDWPKIRAAYESMGVEVEQIDADEAKRETATAADIGQEAAEDRAAVEIPEDWEGLSWQKLRALAAKVSDDAIINKDGAIEAIRNELSRRRSEETASNGPTRREMNADLESMGVEVEPALDIEDLAELHAEKREGKADGQSQ